MSTLTSPEYLAAKNAVHSRLIKHHALHGLDNGDTFRQLHRVLCVEHHHDFNRDLLWQVVEELEAFERITTNDAPLDYRPHHEEFLPAKGEALVRQQEAIDDALWHAVSPMFPEPVRRAA